MDHTYACNNLTDIECEGHAITGNGSLYMKILKKSCKTRKNTLS